MRACVNLIRDFHRSAETTGVALLLRGTYRLRTMALAGNKLQGQRGFGRGQAELSGVAVPVSYTSRQRSRVGAKGTCWQRGRGSESGSRGSCVGDADGQLGSVAAAAAVHSSSKLEP